MSVTVQITHNEILSGISKAIYDVYGDTLNIYKEKQEYIDTPAVTMYCIDSEHTMGRYDRTTHIYNIIINYFHNDSLIINNNRPNMFENAHIIAKAIEYINLPAYTKDVDGQLIQTTLLNRGSNITIEEKEGFVQIGVTYTVRTKNYKELPKMKQLEYNESIGG